MIWDTRRWSLLQVLAAIAVANPLPSAVKYVVHEKRDAIENGWAQVGRIPDHERLVVRIGLKQQNLRIGSDLLAEISHPESPKFGQHMSSQEVADLFAPSADTIAAVTSWLAANEVSADRLVFSENKAWLAFDAAVGEAEALLRTEYHQHEHSASGQKAIACDSYHLPEHVQEHIDYIKPGIKIASPVVGAGRRGLKKRAHPQVHDEAAFKPKPNDTTTCDRAITPACIRALYQMPLNNLSDPSNALGIFETGDFFAQEDLNSFFADFEPRISKGTGPQVLSVDGGHAPKKPEFADGESDLDLEIAFPLIHPQKIKLFQVDDDVYTVNGGGGLFNNFLDAIDGSYCTYSAFGETGNDPTQDDVYPDTQPNGYKGKLQCGAYNLTNVVSISYSRQEADLPYYYQQRQCNEFMKLALQGHTILVSSGDSGVSGRSYDPEPNGCLGRDHKVFNPGFPSCPYITVVGATQVAPGKTVHDPEIAAYDVSHDGTDSAYSSGGGFSNIYSIPDYQKEALATYFSRHDPGYKSYSALHNATHNDSTATGANGGIYNRIGRGLPDVSANGLNIATYIGVTSKDGGYGLSEGTSASAPMFASIINNLNEHRLKAGKKPIGYLNHILYSNPQVFNDITNGTNPGCGTKGFSAVPGWDPVTGLGTPIYPKLLDLFMKLP